MKIAMICPSNILYMPYVGNYTEIFDEIDIKYNIINWDRFKLEKKSEFTYRDSKIGYQRNILDYFKYSRFILNILNQNDFDKIIIFGVQLTFFLKRYLIKNYHDRFIIDIRDYNRILKYINIKKLIDSSTYTVLSSPGFKEWLPESNKYVINHNTQLKSMEKLNAVDENFKKKENININYIGSIRDYKVNRDFIHSLKNNSSIKLIFNGAGLINKDIESYVSSNSIRNVLITGKYIREEEKNLYINSDIVNILIINDTINNKTLLPNRLYNAAIYGKPVIAFQGTYLSSVVEKYNLGIIFKSFDNVEEIIINYISNFNIDYYDKNRRKFLENVLEENSLFNLKLTEFVKY